MAMSLSLSGKPQTFSDDFAGIHSLRVNNIPAVIIDFYNDGDSVLYALGGVNEVNGIFTNDVFAWDTDTVRCYGSGIRLYSHTECIHKFNDTIYIGGGNLSFSNMPTATLSSGTVSRGRAVPTGNP